ncbi:MAG: DNA adenine methylase [Dehalococcoidia bacterium]
MAASAPSPALPPHRPLLKWAGGKRWLTPRIAELWRGSGASRLVEPMAGSLAVSLGIAPARALLNDRNSHVINFYEQVRDGLTLDRPMENERESYYAARAEFNALVREGRDTTPAAAQLFYYLNRTGYNGLCRFNSRGEFNVPFGRYRTITYARELAIHAELFGRWEFHAGDFAALTVGPGDFIYADPPYDVPFTRYAKDDFTWDDQVRFATWLAGHEGPVALSNQATPRIVELYRELGFAIELLNGPRSISCSGSRTPAPEVLATRGL